MVNHATWSRPLPLVLKFLFIKKSKFVRLMCSFQLCALMTKPGYLFLIYLFVCGCVAPVNSEEQSERRWMRHWHPETDAFWPSWSYWNAPVQWNSVDLNLLMMGPQTRFDLVLLSCEIVCCLYLGVTKLFYSCLSTFSLTCDKFWINSSLGRMVRWQYHTYWMKTKVPHRNRIFICN